MSNKKSRKPVTENVAVSLNGAEEYDLDGLEEILKTCKSIPLLPVPEEITGEKIRRILVSVNHINSVPKYSVWYDVEDDCVRAYEDSTQAQMDKLLEQYR